MSPMSHFSGTWHSSQTRKIVKWGAAKKKIIEELPKFKRYLGNLNLGRA